MLKRFSMQMFNVLARAKPTSRKSGMHARSGSITGVSRTFRPPFLVFRLGAIHFVQCQAPSLAEYVQIVRFGAPPGSGKVA